MGCTEAVNRANAGMLYCPSAGPVRVQHWATAGAVVMVQQWANTGAMYSASAGPVPTYCIGPLLVQ